MFNTAQRFGTSLPKINSIPTPSCSNVAACGIRAAGGEVEVDREDQRRLRDPRQREQADAAGLDKAAQGRRRARHKGAAAARNENLVVSHESGPTENELHHEAGFSCSRATKDQQSAAREYYGRRVQKD